MERHYGVPTEAQLGRWTKLLAEAFGLRDDEVLSLHGMVGAESTRVLTADGVPVGGLLAFPCGLAVGERHVPNVAVALVGIAPERRRQGHASAMMAALLRAERASGQLLSSLYASNQPLYRGVGYEQAGTSFYAEVPVTGIGLRDHDLPVRRLGPEDERALDAVHRAEGVKIPGFFARSSWQWRRLRNPRTGPACVGLGVEEGGRLAGWVWYRQMPGEHGRFPSLQVVDLFAATPRAARNLWATLADQGSLARTVVIPSAPTDLFYQVLPHPFVTLTHFENWMVRVLDPQALAARGYPASRAGRVELEIEDPLGLCSGRHVLEVEGGHARVTPGGSGRARVHVRGLASLYTGFASGAQVEALGLGENLGLLGELLAGPAPWTPDRY